MTHGNHLLAQLGPKDRRLLLGMGESVRLMPGLVLFERGEDAVSIFFPTGGAVLLSVPAHSTCGLGVLLVGREGMLGMHRVLGSSLSSMRAVVQTLGDALRIDATVFSGGMAASATLHRAMLDYVGVIVNQIAASAACARHHAIGPRLAGWLLITRDRGCADSFHLTQAALAAMLGVRRVGVTVAAHELQRLHLIDYHRGNVTVLDVPGLRAIAGDCYPARHVAEAGGWRSVGARRGCPSRRIATQGF